MYVGERERERETERECLWHRQEERLSCCVLGLFISLYHHYLYQYILKIYNQKYFSYTFFFSKITKQLLLNVITFIYIYIYIYIYIFFFFFLFFINLIFFIYNIKTIYIFFYNIKKIKIIYSYFFNLNSLLAMTRL